MTRSSEFPLGVIEGFYGRPWSHETRLAYADHLTRLGLNSYLYCPKSDPFLRKQWQQPWPNAVRSQLEEISQVYSSRELAWGVGLSPFALYQNYGPDERQLLRRKVLEIDALEVSTLAILFDDMPGAMASLASRQAEIVADVCAWMPGCRIMVCPTYYSFDPVLEKYFGDKPEKYWSQLGQEMPEDVDLFWTGNRVCSESIVGQDIDAINREIGRNVMLWDNYPVNDGAQRSNFIYTSKLTGRPPELRAKVAGHFCNPMNQAELSLPALIGLAELYGVLPPDAEVWLEELFGAEFARQLARDGESFEAEGLSGLGEARCRDLATLYDSFAGNAAREVAGWLRGEYTFDPACLTD